MTHSVHSKATPPRRRGPTAGQILKGILYLIGMGLAGVLAGFSVNLLWAHPFWGGLLILVEVGGPVIFLYSKTRRRE